MSDTREILILESGADQIRLSLVQHCVDAVKVLDVCSFISQERRDDRNALQDQNLVDQLSVAISQRDWVGKDVVCLISGGTVACQNFDMPALPDPALRQAVLLKLGQQLHFPVAQAIVDIRPMSSATAAAQNQVRVAVTAVQADVSQAAIDAATRLGLKLVAISASGSALTLLAASAIKREKGLHGVLHFGERVSVLVVLNGATPSVTSELAFGLDDFTKALMRPIISGDEVIQLDAEKANRLRDTVGIPDANEMIEMIGVEGSRLYPLIEPTLQKFAQQLTQWMTFAGTTENGARVAGMTVVGPGAGMRGFSAALSKRLNIEAVTSDWLNGRVTLTGSAAEAPVDSFAVAAAAAIHRAALPDLIPPEIRKSWKMQRIRRSTAMISPIVAAVIIGFTFLFNQIQGFTRTSHASQEALSELQTLADINARWLAEQGAVKRMETSFSEFAAATPAWVGLFKELSQVLPSEMRATKFSSRLHQDGMSLRIDANIYTPPTGRDFDEVIEHTLRSLERSPFFTRVQLLNSMRHPSDSSNLETGVMSVELQLAYEKPKTGN